MTELVLPIGGRAVPVVLPSLRDPRLHVAAVIISVHVLGQVGLHFLVSVPQILAAILTCAVIEVAITFARTRALVWPASAMLTGSGVALILRLVGTPPGDPWSTFGWPVFSAIAGLSLLTKYLIRYRGSHVFNPSNVGLVVAFLVLGSSTIEPLDFWWAPLDGWLVAAYAVILGGGLLITRRLRLLELAATFWLAFAAGLAVLAASGHCLTARWAFAPVCGFDFWRVLVTSPEVLIFLFFMITDPRTVPRGRVARVVFGFLVAAASTLLVAPQANEFGAKVGLLAGLVVVCAARPALERVLPAPDAADDALGPFVARLLGSGSALRRAIGALSGVVALAVLGAAVVVAGTPARGLVLPDVREVLASLPRTVDPGTLPPVSIRQEVADWDHELAGPELAAVLRTLADNLDLEAQALLRSDPTILAAVDHGDRLAEMEARLREAAASGRTTIERYRFDSIEASLLVPFGVQTGLSLGLTGRGTVTIVTYDRAGALLDRRTEPFHLTFALRRATGDRWLLVGVLPADGR